MVRALSSSLPRTESHTEAWRRSLVTSTPVIVTKPIRGSVRRSTSEAMTSRSTSPRRSVRGKRSFVIGLVHALSGRQDLEAGVAGHEPLHLAQGLRKHGVIAA